MTRLPYILVFIITIFSYSVLWAQQPKCFVYDDNTGLPSNEVYSVIQDKKGFIWIGCDAGLFKFDGVRYIPYKCATQKSKSITGLTISSSGKMYCCSFQSQVFYLENDTLKELQHALPNVSVINIVSGTEENIYVSHNGGISRYNENQKQWKDYFDYNLKDVLHSGKWASKTIKGSQRDTIVFIYAGGIAQIAVLTGLSTSVEQLYKTDLFQHTSVGKFEIERFQNELWIFAKENDTIYRFADNRLGQMTDTKLNKLLAGRKIANVKVLPDSNLWICTYKGIIKFNPKNSEAELFYPQFSFSDCLIDREGNYWFSTLHSGVLRVPDLAFKVWNELAGLTKITGDSTSIYFATLNGIIGKLSVLSGETTFFHTGFDADVQSLDYDISENTLWFNVNNRLFGLKGDKITESKNMVQAIKSFRKIRNSAFAASSQGLFINGKKINTYWSREIKVDETSHTAWIATNDGLLKFSFVANEWRQTQRLFENTQILSIDFFADEKLLYVLSFDGKIYAVSADGSNHLLGALPETVQAYKLKYYQQKIHLATNKGLWIYDLKNNQWTLLNGLSGLASDKVRGVEIVRNTIWLATGNGLQQIPLGSATETSLARVYLKNFRSGISDLRLSYGEPLVLQPEASIYASNGNFEYLYRINRNEWIKLPAGIEQIELQNIPSGNFEIELKAIDHLGRDSENVILLKGYVNPPFWLRWWFYLCLIAVGIIVAILISRAVIRNIKRKELAKTQLVNSQLKAIRAQMNPHFMYNTLNSIQDLILQNDIKNTNYYLSKFSQLMRQILAFSEEEKVLLSEETEMLKNYLELEKLRFGNDFVFTLNIDQNIDSSRTYISSLIVQPYVENAVKHGLLHKKGIKKLDITFSFTNSFIEIRIEDNGIGRKRSEEIKQRSGILHKSFAENAVQKRLELLNNNSMQKIEVSISNINDNEKNTGTRVTIILSMNPKQPFVNV